MAQVKFHTVEQPESDITTFVLSCNRLDVLDKTLQSFYQTKEYTTKMVIVDDSAIPGVFETLVERYGQDCDVICFPRNRSQWWAMDWMVSYCDTEYIFYLEDDWEFVQTGYLQKSKEILQKYRNVGTVDISWRTFDWQGLNCYDKTLIDDSFYWKQAWTITDYHLAWYGWIGSPNLKRRDDLILLGRVEKWHNEWNIDRKFRALGFRAVFLNGEYVRHLGDLCSAMEGKRPNDGTTPEDYYPAELQAERIWPKLNYSFLDTKWQSPYEVTMVTAILDIGRKDRDFNEYYIKGLDHILQCRNPLIVYAEEKYHEHIRNKRGPLPLVLKKLELEDLHNSRRYKFITNIIASPEWKNQSPWMKDSVISSPDYIPLTLLKAKLLEESAEINTFNSNRFMWIDSGCYNSFHMYEHVDLYNFNKVPYDKMFMASYEYNTDSEIHGYNIDTMTKICGKKPEHVCRATLFGGKLSAIKEFNKKFYEIIDESIFNDSIGTEESIFTIISILYPELVDIYNMHNGDIRYYLNTIRSRP